MNNVSGWITDRKPISSDGDIFVTVQDGAYETYDMMVCVDDTDEMSLLDCYDGQHSGFSVHNIIRWCSIDTIKMLLDCWNGVIAVTDKHVLLRKEEKDE